MRSSFNSTFDLNPGVIVFGSDQEVAELMKAVKRMNATGHFNWIGSDGWSARALVSEGKKKTLPPTEKSSLFCFPLIKALIIMIMFVGNSLEVEEHLRAKK